MPFRSDVNGRLDVNGKDTVDIRRLRGLIVGGKNEMDEGIKRREI